MSARLVFTAAVRVHGQLHNVAIAIARANGWLKLSPFRHGGAEAVAAAEVACHELNALLHAGFPLECLAAAAQRSSSNHAEIVKCAAQAAAAQERSVHSFEGEL